MQATARRTLRRLAFAGVTLISGAAVSACQDGHAVPETLADGMPARLSTVAFEGVGAPVIATETRAVHAEGPAPCADALRAIDRIGVAGASRTLPAGAARELLACDWTPPSGWCGIAFARPRADRPLDPRLSITCRDADGRPVGFLWVDPGRRAAFVVVTGDDYAESYAVLPGGPVRVTTGRVDAATSSATVTVSEHAADGRLLRVRRIEAQVSG